MAGKTGKIVGYEVQYINSHGRMVRSVSFGPDQRDEAAALHRRDGHKEPGARGFTLYQYSNGSETSVPGLQEGD